jgi:hypothetical protein
MTLNSCYRSCRSIVHFGKHKCTVAETPGGGGVFKLFSEEGVHQIVKKTIGGPRG